MATGPKWEDNEKTPSWTRHEITYFLSGQQQQSGSENSEMTLSWTCHEITHPL